MPARLFSLRGVPDDEADDIRALLTENEIDFYETLAGNWGISNPGIWLPEENQLSQAKVLLENYQTERAVQQRALHEQRQKEGKQITFWELLLQNPLKVIAYIGIVFVIIYFSTKPFLSLGN
jgi:hypothetical protein